MGQSVPIAQEVGRGLKWTFEARKMGRLRGRLKHWQSGRSDKTLFRRDKQCSKYLDRLNKIHLRVGTPMTYEDKK